MRSSLVIVRVLTFFHLRELTTIQDSSYILCSPRVLWFNPDEKTDKMLMQYIVWMLSPSDDHEDFIPTADELKGITFERWGKVEIDDGGDKISGTIASTFVGEMHRLFG